MASLFKTVAENKDVLKQPFKATAKKGKKAPEEKKSRKRRESYAKEICQVLQQTCEGTGVSEPVLEILNSFVHDLFERIAGEASKLAFYERRRRARLVCYGVNVQSLVEEDKGRSCMIVVLGRVVVAVSTL